jgi:hypothetical protein
MQKNIRRKILRNVTKAQVLEELEKVAEYYNFIEFSRQKFEKVASFGSGVITRQFDGSWRKALDSLNIHLMNKGITLSPRLSTRNQVHSDKELFDEIGRIWKLVGHQPSLTEWREANPKILYNFVNFRFSRWIKACSEYIEYVMGNEIREDNFIIPDQLPKKTQLKARYFYKNSNYRNITILSRMKILRRDNFCCVFCGKSPVTDNSTKLHIGHIKPFSQGGSCSMENLQTICNECNNRKRSSLVDIF